MEEFKIDPSIAYDVVPLPSGGIYYPNKKKSVRVAYLIAPDEDILQAPNLVATNTVIEELLRRKILDRDISIDDLVEDDRRAILVFLRNTAYGSEYKVTTIDPKTDKEFEFTMDLSILKSKEFTLVEDVNGEYPYRFEKAKADITFKFLTKKQEKEIDGLTDSWNGIGVAPVISKRYLAMIQSVNGNRDQMLIKQFVDKLPIKDGQDFRKYVNQHKPGLNLVQETKTPSGDIIQVEIGFGVEFFRPFYGL